MRLSWRRALGVVISVALLWWTLRGESPAAVWDVLRHSNVALFLLATALATVGFPIRAGRWRYILAPVAGDLPFGPLWRATAIGMMVNNVVPARAGELARALVVARETGRVRFSAALASLVVDRLFDTMVVLLLLLVVVSLPAFPSGAVVMGWPVATILLIGSGIALLAIVVLAIVAVYPRRMVALWDFAFGRAAPKVAERGKDFLLGFGAGLGVLRDARRFVIVFVWALVQWVINGASFWVAFRAVGLEAPFTAALFLQSLLAGVVAVPSAPGFFGTFEAATKIALGVYGIDDTFAVSYALGYHLLTFIPITVIGFWYLGKLGLHFRDLSAAPPGSVPVA